MAIFFERLLLCNVMQKFEVRDLLTARRLANLKRRFFMDANFQRYSLFGSSRNLNFCETCCLLLNEVGRIFNMAAGRKNVMS